MEGQGFTVEAAGREYALFRVNGKVYAVDNVCPHEGAQPAQGEVQNGVVTCHWHGWAFDVCTGCSVAPTGHTVCRYETKTFRLDNSSGVIPPHRPGQFASVCVTIEGSEAWRSFTIRIRLSRCANAGFAGAIIPRKVKEQGP